MKSKVTKMESVTENAYTRGGGFYSCCFLGLPFEWCYIANGIYECTHLIVDVDHTVCHTIGKVWSQPHRFAEVSLLTYTLRLAFISFGTLGQYRRSRRARWPINAKRTIIRTQFDGSTNDDIHVDTFRHLTNTITWHACVVCWLLFSVKAMEWKAEESYWIEILCFLLEWDLPRSNHT